MKVVTKLPLSACLILCLSGLYLLTEAVVITTYSSPAPTSASHYDINKKDLVCLKQQEIVRNSTGDSFIVKTLFEEEEKHSIILTWAGDNSKTLILATVQSTNPLVRSTVASDLYRSLNDGINFTKITDKVNEGSSIVIRKQNGLQRNLMDTSHIFLIANNPHDPTGTLMWISENRGESWRKIVLNFDLSDAIIFHHSKRNFMLALDSGTRKLWGSSDAGLTWKVLHSNVMKCSWGSSAEPDGTIYITHDSNYNTVAFSLLSRIFNSQLSNRAATRILLKTKDFGSTWQQLQDHIYSFSLKEKFLFISKADTDSSVSRHLKVSTDYGAKFDHVQLPSVTPDRFFSILDMSEGLVFIHVDNPGQQGHGVIYTSDSNGEIFSQSLKRHLYSDLSSITDFGKVVSMSGTFLTTVMHEDNSMHSVITFNRGAQWHKLRKPDNADCKAEDVKAGKPCYLQIANSYSMVRGVRTLQPVSIPTAIGLIFVHGHVAAALQGSNPDVFVSSDGGYNWKKSLDGPHHIQIADHGGLIVAVPYVNYPKTVKFSTDQGHCWHEFTFTTEEFIFTGLLTEPGNKAMTVAIWGFGLVDRKWRIYVLDFEKVVTRNCGNDDYVSWLSNGEENSDKGETRRGCVFGVKQTYYKMKEDSWCRNGYGFNPNVHKSAAPCTCTQDDYECEYGYTRPVDSMDCKRDDAIKELDVCVGGNTEKILTAGYRKLPGNNCTGGFTPDKQTQMMLVKNKVCNEHAEDSQDKALDDKRVNFLKETEAEKAKAHSVYQNKVVAIFVPLSLTLVIVLIAILAILLLAKARARRRRLLAYHYSSVSSRGRTETATNGSANGSLFKPQDDLINPGIPQPSYSSRPSQGQGPRGYKPVKSDKQLLVENEELDDDVQLLQ